MLLSSFIKVIYFHQLFANVMNIQILKVEECDFNRQFLFDNNMGHFPAPRFKKGKIIKSEIIALSFHMKEQLLCL